ncbi:B9 domain-containing protein 1 [Leptidea sinapis]|uniref:B9 domain-containing protein 1 n=1 Tax=Leptidea sinapis TaxID=189913 RepID=UPI002144742F|nr:B9 domain-containing protein 1 [Leptidea sinapis]
MDEHHVTKFMVSFSGQLEFITFPAGVFDDQLYVQYNIVWGPDWKPITGLSSGTSQIARSGRDPEKVVFNLPIEMVFSSTNIHGWPQLVVTLRAKNFLTGDSLRGYGLFLLPPVVGTKKLTTHLFRPRSATLLGDWLAWIIGRQPELAEPTMLASGKDNYLLRTESYGTVTLKMAMISKDLRKLGYDNQPAWQCNAEE